MRSKNNIGYGSIVNHPKTAGFSFCFHLPGFFPFWGAPAHAAHGWGKSPSRGAAQLAGHQCRAEGSPAHAYSLRAQDEAPSKMLDIFAFAKAKW